MSMSTTHAPSPVSARPRIVIVGCGFGGLEAARALADADVDITVVDRTNHHLFQPLLYQVATAGLASPAISAPIRRLFREQRNVTSLLGEVVDIDTQGQAVLLQTGESLPYDHLVVAAGATHSYFGRDEWAAHAPGIKTLADATEVRRRILMAYEEAERIHDPVQREALLTFVVIGGGPTGVEMAGTLAEISRRTLPGEFRHFEPSHAHVLLLEGGSRVLQAMPPELSRRAEEQLKALGVDVRTGAKVTHIDEQGLEVETASPAEGAAAAGEAGARYTIRSKTVIWAAGVAASPLGRILQRHTGCETDRAGRVTVEADLSLPGHPEVWVIGDLAAARSHHGNEPPKPVPGVSPAAKQMGRHAAANLRRRLQGQATLPFHYRDYGNLATIGRNSAVVDLTSPVGPIRFSGWTAWLFWLVAHIYFLIGFRNRLMVLFDWASAYWSSQRYARIIANNEPHRSRAARAPDQPPAAPPPGEA